MKVYSLALVGMLCCAPSGALAHTVGLECTPRIGSNEVSVEVFFDDDSPGIGAKVEVLDGARNVVASGKADARGLWKFTAPLPGSYLVKVDAGAGHLAERKITVDDWRAAAEPVSGGLEEGSGRRERPTFQWLKIGIGLGTIFLISIAFIIARRRA